MNVKEDTTLAKRELILNTDGSLASLPRPRIAELKARYEELVERLRAQGRLSVGNILVALNEEGYNENEWIVSLLNIGKEQGIANVESDLIGALGEPTAQRIADAINLYSQKGETSNLGVTPEGQEPGAIHEALVAILGETGGNAVYAGLSSYLGGARHTKVSLAAPDPSRVRDLGEFGRVPDERTDEIWNKVKPQLDDAGTPLASILANLSNDSELGLNDSEFAETCVRLAHLGARQELADELSQNPLGFLLGSQGSPIPAGQLN